MKNNLSRYYKDETDVELQELFGRKERFLLEDRKCDSEIRKGLQRNTRDVREDEKEIDSQSKRPRR